MSILSIAILGLVTMIIAWGFLYWLFHIKYVSHEDCLDTDEEELKLLKARDLEKAKSFVDKLYPHQITNDFLSELAYKRRIKEHLESGESLKHIVPFETKDASFIRDALIPNIEKRDFKEWVLSLINIMEQYDFASQPSVNLKTEEKINIDKELTSYKVFAKVNLLEHTANVIQEYNNFLGSTKRNYGERSRAILGVACLMHDFGKSINLVKALDLKSRIEEGKYKHWDISEELVWLLANSYSSYFTSVDKDNIEDINRIANLVKNHHTKQYNISKVDDLTLSLIEIDREARNKEWIMLKNKGAV